MSRGRNRWQGRNRQPSPQDVERQARAIQLRTLRLPFSQIARELGCSTSTAHDLVSKGLRFYMAQYGAEEAAAEMLLVMDVAGRVCMQTILDQTVTDGKPTTRIETKLAAIHRLVEVETRKANLLGTDAPKTLKIRGEIVHVDQLDQAIAALEADLGRGDRHAAELESGGRTELASEIP